MTREEAVAIAERYLATHRVVSGPLRLARYCTGAEYGELQKGPAWAVYFWYDKPVENPPDDMAETCLCVDVDVTSGKAKLLCWL
jgi:hypothetical protein